MGSGAIGGFYGGLLSLSGEDVILLVGRKRQMESIHDSGLRIKGILGDHELHLDVTEDPKDIHSADLVFITTKAYDTIEAASQIRHLVDGGAYVLCLQNGLDTEVKVAEYLGTTRVLRGTTCMGALVTGPGEITATGRGITEIGSHFPENREMVDKIVKRLKQAGFDARSSDNIEGVVWTKTIVNCGINPIGALTGLTNGEIHDDMALRNLVVKLVEEAVQVANSLNVQLTTGDPIRYALGTAKATGGNTNSMLQDVRACKRTEIESITGEVIRRAEKLGIDTPFSETIYALIKALESKRLVDVGLKPEMRPLATEELLKAISTP
jgi:2-dehydropantoate 2-reductase